MLHLPTRDALFGVSVFFRVHKVRGEVDSDDLSSAVAVPDSVLEAMVVCSVTFPDREAIAMELCSVPFSFSSTFA